MSNELFSETIPHPEDPTILDQATTNPNNFEQLEPPSSPFSVVLCSSESETPKSSDQNIYSETQQSIDQFCSLTHTNTTEEMRSSSCLSNSEREWTLNEIGNEICTIIKLLFDSKSVELQTSHSHEISAPQ